MYVKYVKCFFVRCLYCVYTAHYKRTANGDNWAEGGRLVAGVRVRRIYRKRASHITRVVYCLSYTYKFVHTTEYSKWRAQSERTKSAQIPRVGNAHTHTQTRKLRSFHLILFSTFSRVFFLFCEARFIIKTIPFLFLFSSGSGY